jgi:hypothetical protein
MQIKPIPCPNHIQNLVPRPVAACPHSSAYNHTTPPPSLPALSPAFISPKGAYICPPIAPLWEVACVLQPLLGPLHLSPLSPLHFAVDSPSPPALLPALPRSIKHMSMQTKSIDCLSHSQTQLSPSTTHPHHAKISCPSLTAKNEVWPLHSKITVLYRKTLAKIPQYIPNQAYPIQKNTEISTKIPSCTRKIPNSRFRAGMFCFVSCPK